MLSDSSLCGCGYCNEASESSFVLYGIGSVHEQKKWCRHGCTSRTASISPVCSKMSKQFANSALCLINAIVTFISVYNLEILVVVSCIQPLPL